jgi:hypothetical protein
MRGGRGYRREEPGMIRIAWSLLACLITVAAWGPDNFGYGANGNDLIGTWAGRAAGPGGGPPTGDILVIFQKDGDEEVTGKITVTAPGGSLEYSGKIDSVELEGGKLKARVIFPLGESAIEVHIRGPVEKQTIRGDFTVIAQGQPLGEGTFQISKQ